MDVSITLSGMAFNAVEAATTELGTTKGGWVYAGQRPCYEAKTPAFYVLEHPLTHRQVIQAMNVEGESSDRPMDELTSLDVKELAHHVMAQDDYAAVVNEWPGAWEVRPLTQAEWVAAKAQKKLALDSGLTERLADAPASNNRGAMMDGRPRPNDLLGPAAHQIAAIAVHPRNDDVTAVGSVPYDRPLPNVVARLALTPVREGIAPRVPARTDVWKNVRSELLWTTVLGIVPSFLIPVLRGMSDYAIEGWFNLLFGGLLAGFFTGAIWRPKRPVLTYDEVDSSSMSVAQ